MMNSIFDVDATSDGAVALLPARKDKKKAQNLREGSCRGSIDSSSVTTYRQIVIDNNNNLRQQSPSESLIQSVSREKFINVLNLILY
ncbi:hypothetical protein TPENAI_70118 [Tenacibaculum litopenaei]|uniref:hypothetical protein n=1 Tax=Tenacibaculum litopenaei TaxID=396016 RepID=UPI003893CB71